MSSIFESPLFNLPVCFSKYCRIISSVIFPVLHAPYPIPHRCLPQYRSFNFGYSFWSNLDERPFNLFTNWLRAILGGYSTCMWTWSLLRTPPNILTSSESHTWINSSRHRSLMSPISTLYRYFVIHTIWTVNLDTIWLLRLKSSTYRFYRVRPLKSCTKVHSFD